MAFGDRINQFLETLRERTGSQTPVRNFLGNNRNAFLGFAMGGDGWSNSIGGFAQGAMLDDERRALEEEKARQEQLRQEANQLFMGLAAPHLAGAPQVGGGTFGAPPASPSAMGGGWMLAGSGAGAPAFGTYGTDWEAYLSSLAPGLTYEGMDPAFGQQLALAADAYQDQTGQAPGFTSMVRSPEVQAQLYANYTQQPVEYPPGSGTVYSPNVGPGQQGLAAPPGQSRHQSGAAADIADGDFLTWMQQNAGTYGLGFLPGQAGIDDPGHVQMAAGGQAPTAQAETDPRWQTAMTLLSSELTAPLGQQMMLQLLTEQPPAPEDPINMAPGNTLYDPNTRQPIFTAPENADPATRPRAEDQNGVLRYLDTGEPVFPDVTALPEGPDFGDENALRAQFNALTAPFRDTAQAYNRIEAAYRNPSAASDVSLIFAYMRMLDPASTVREGEFATAQQTTGLPGQIVNLYNQLLTGERLNDAQRQDFYTQAQGLYQASMNQYNQYAEFYRGLVPAGVDPNRIVMPLGTPQPATDPATWRTATNPQTGERLRLNPATNQWEPF